MTHIYFTTQLGTPISIAMNVCILACVHDIHKELLLTFMSVYYFLLRKMLYSDTAYEQRYEGKFTPVAFLFAVM